MKKLVEDIQVNDVVLYKGNKLTIVGFYEVNGEGIGFIGKNELQQEETFSVSCGVELTLV